MLPGFPGSPADWINVVGITAAYSTLLGDGAAVKPTVLAMPDANGGRRISLQCLDVRHGPQDATFLAHDLPEYLPSILRVQPQGPAWVLRATPRVTTAPPTWPPAADHPAPGERPDPPVLARRRGKDISGLRAARQFQRLVLARQPGVQLNVVPGGGHTMATWRALVPSLLEWMTPLLTQASQYPVPVSQVGKAHVSRKDRHRQAGVSQAARGSVRDTPSPPA